MVYDGPGRPLCAARSRMSPRDGCMTPDPDQAKTYHVVSVVWGREYLDLFLNTCLPNQLGEGNVQALPTGSRYRILTRRDDLDFVEAHPTVHAARSVIPVDVVAIDALDAAS